MLSDSVLKVHEMSPNVIDPDPDYAKLFLKTYSI